MNAPKWQAPDAKSEDNGDVDVGVGVERFQGHGIIRRGDERLAEVDYDVIITPAELRGTGLTYEAGSPVDRAPKVGPDISGRLLGPFFQAQNFAEGIHTLVLEDGSEFDFRVLQPDTNEIVGVTVLRRSAPSTSTSRESTSRKSKT